MKGAVISVRTQIQLQRLAFDHQLAGHIIDDQVSEIGLAGHWADAGKLGAGKTYQIVDAWLWIWHSFKLRLFGRLGDGCIFAQLGQFFICHRNADFSLARRNNSLVFIAGSATLYLELRS